MKIEIDLDQRLVARLLAESDDACISFEKHVEAILSSNSSQVCRATANDEPSIDEARSEAKQIAQTIVAYSIANVIDGEVRTAEELYSLTGLTQSPWLKLPSRTRKLLGRELRISFGRHASCSESGQPIFTVQGRTVQNALMYKRVLKD